MSSSTLINHLKDRADGESEADVVVVGAGPAGLMLATNLVRFGLKTVILDDRQDQTSTGRADGLQPKTIETLRQMRIADPLIRKGARVYDICFWSSSAEQVLHRTSRQIHYPPVVDVLEPYILLVHQGMVEELFIEDLKARGIDVWRNAQFQSYERAGDGGSLRIEYHDLVSMQPRTVTTRYLVGCDGAHSQVRKQMPGVIPEGSSSEAIWAVLDGVLDTDFPDIWSKAVVHSQDIGSVLCIPRERNMTRLYVELKSETGEPLPKAQATQSFVMARARQIFKPYHLEVAQIEWFGVYQIGQRVANHFADGDRRVFIAGDASHTHSPKAAQGMNTSMHDSLNLAWKLNLTIRGLAKPKLLDTYEQERQKIARDLISFDFEHAKSFHAGDAEALARNFEKNVHFISGVGAEYSDNAVNKSTIKPVGCLRSGSLLLPARVTRYVDANPVDIQLDIPMLGQFRIYFLCPSVHSCRDVLTAVSSHICGVASKSVIASAMKAARSSYETRKVPLAEVDDFVQPRRYTRVSELFTFALVTGTSKSDFEISELPSLFQQSRWTIYLDDVPNQDTRGQNCLEKWMGSLKKNDIAIVNVRPDGYVACLGKWNAGKDPDTSINVITWLDSYYSDFLGHES